MTAADEIAADDRLIVALDKPDLLANLDLAEWLGDAVSFYKIGLGLLTSGGLALANELKGDHGKRVFLDMKLFDIGATVEAAVRGFSRFDIDFLTVHGDPHVVAAAAQAKDDVKVLAVTFLTSLDRADLDAALIAPWRPGRTHRDTRGAGLGGWSGRCDRLASGGRGDPGSARGGGQADRDAGGCGRRGPGSATRSAWRDRERPSRTGRTISSSAGPSTRRTTRAPPSPRYAPTSPDGRTPPIPGWDRRRALLGVGASGQPTRRARPEPSSPSSPHPCRRRCSRRQAPRLRRRSRPGRRRGSAEAGG